MKIDKFILFLSYLIIIINYRLKYRVVPTVGNIAYQSGCHDWAGFLVSDFYKSIAVEFFECFCRTDVPGEYRYVSVRGSGDGNKIQLVAEWNNFDDWFFIKQNLLFIYL